MHRNEIGPLSYTMQKKKKSSQNGPKDLNVRPETVKLPTRKQQNLHDIDLSNDFFDMPQKVQATKIYKWKYIKSCENLKVLFGFAMKQKYTRNKK